MTFCHHSALKNTIGGYIALDPAELQELEINSLHNFMNLLIIYTTAQK